jgi:hypothetical protein
MNIPEQKSSIVYAEFEFPVPHSIARSGNQSAQERLGGDCRYFKRKDHGAAGGLMLIAVRDDHTLDILQRYPDVIELSKDQYENLLFNTSISDLSEKIKFMRVNEAVIAAGIVEELGLSPNLDSAV